MKRIYNDSELQPTNGTYTEDGLDEIRLSEDVIRREILRLEALGYPARDIDLMLYEAVAGITLEERLRRRFSKEKP
jgi:hypothetical protein